MASTSKTANKIVGYLKKIIGTSVGEIFSLTPGEVIIGRNQQFAQISIQDPNVSRSHCALKCGENGCFIKDMKSVNGTFLDGMALIPEKFYPLKECAGIYLGPPGEAPVAFIFLTKMPNEQFCEINASGCNQRNKISSIHTEILSSNKSNNCLKRQSDSEASNTNGRLSQRKKIATSSSSSVNKDMLDKNNLSDCSFSSLDSLQTRVRKWSSKKNKNKNSKNMKASSTSVSPQLRPSSNADLENKPSTSTFHSETSNAKRKPVILKEFDFLNTLFNQSENSTPDTMKDDDSESLLNESKILIDCEPYAFSQQLPLETAQGKQNKNKKNIKREIKESVEEQLQEATLELQKLKKDKLCLHRLVQELKSKEFLKKKFQSEFQKMLEDELMCNICTEVFMKAITLGCSHTFCEYCISEWKKKQKQCPICREKITSETKILVLDNFINKAFEQLDMETQNKRAELAFTREKANAVKKKKNKRSRGRSRQIRSDSSDAANNFNIELQHISQLISQSTVDREFQRYLFPSDLSALSDDSDMSVVGYGYFGGYGRCYNCGRRGHWANGCPDM